MTKIELINKVSEITAQSKKDVAEVVDVLFEVVTNTVASGEDVGVYNFGTFKTKTQHGREGTITMGSRKGEPYKTEDKTVVAFKPSKALADLVAGE